ncbi:MAG: hypothetical protein JWM81_17 [Candidatus Saccharibacteria bacterium]|jgi:hypothetical protein|nr:hypothetical protein [Candidatus Saccharibacteria bacterium]
MADDYSSRDREYERMRDAHTNSHVARLLATLALIGAAIALAVALTAMNKATDALNLANRNLTTLQTQTR